MVWKIPEEILLEMKDKKLRTTLYEYNAGNELVKRSGDFNDNPPGPTLAGNDLFAGPGASDPWHTTNYAFDGNGSRTAELGEPRDRAYAWDYRERLMAVKEGNKTLQTNEYDPYNRRVSMTANGERTLYVYEGRGVNNHVIYEYPANGKGTGTVNIWFGGRLVCSMTGDRESHYMADALGSVIALTNGSGAVVQRISYEPFGKATVQGSVSENSIGFVGALGVRHDDTTDQDYVWNRYYDPRTGFFVATDPLVINNSYSTLVVQQANLLSYVYSYNDPIGLTDINGLASGACITCITYTAAAVAAAVACLGTGNLLPAAGFGAAATKVGTTCKNVCNPKPKPGTNAPGSHTKG